MSHNILVRQPKSYAYYNCGQAWQIDLPKAIPVELTSAHDAVTKGLMMRSREEPRGSTGRLGARLEDAPQRTPTARLPENKEMVVLRLPAKFKDKLINAGSVVQEVLLQHYGMDLRDPGVSQWLERNAPDVKYAIAVSKQTNSGGGVKPKFRVGSNGTVQVQISSDVDRRLREVSSRYRQMKMERTILEWVLLWVSKYFSLLRRSRTV